MNERIAISFIVNRHIPPEHKKPRLVTIIFCLYNNKTSDLFGEFGEIEQLLILTRSIVDHHDFSGDTLVSGFRSPKD
jgi:hypothetical protein